MIKLFFFLFPFLFFYGCGQSSSHNENNQTLGPSSLGYDFKIDHQCSGSCKPGDNEHCETKQNFTDVSSYCDGLRNANLNSGCARKERKAQYIKDCSQKFEDINIGGWSVSESNCYTESVFKNFDTQARYCSDLMNESLHKGCGLQFRQEKADKFECSH